MGLFFGAKLCDLIGLYAFCKLRHLYSYKDIGLYRDDGLAITSRKSKQELERLKMNTIKTFNELSFKITINIGAPKCSFLDISLDTTNNTFKPYQKKTPASIILIIIRTIRPLLKRTSRK